MQIQCKSCGKAIAADNVNIEQMVAKCTACNAVFGFHAPGSKPAVRQRPTVGMPKGMVVEDQGGELVFTVAWRKPLLVLFLTVFVLIWNGVTWPFFAITYEEGPWFLTAFLSVFVLVGLLMAYVWLCVFFNATEIRVNQAMLVVQHGPLPVPGNCRLRVDEIEQLYVEQKISHNRSSDGHSTTSVSYPLCAQLKDGSRKIVLRTLSDSDTSLYFEQQIEQYLGIEDREMPGEY